MKLELVDVTDGTEWFHLRYENGLLYGVLAVSSLPPNACDGVHSVSFWRHGGDRWAHVADFDLDCDVPVTPRDSARRAWRILTGEEVT